MFSAIIIFAKVMKQLVLCLFCMAFLHSCKEKQARIANKPAWVLDEKKMVDIIVDLRIADAATYINSSAPPRNKANDWFFVMKKHKVQDSIFRKSHDYYAEHPEVAEKLYEQVIDKISEMQADNADGQ